jgi:hypothetical protein
MSMPNIKPSDKIAVGAVLDPVSQAAATVTTGWVSMQTAENLLALLQVGAFGASATVDAKLQQASDATGTGVKDISGKAITQMLAAGGNNKQVMLNVRSEELDVINGFCFVRLSVTVGTAATLIAATLLAMDGRYQPIAQPASVTQTIA